MKRIALAILLVTIASCRSTVENSLGSVIGNYALVTVDGAALPFPGGSAIIVRGAVNLRSDGRYALSQTDSAVGGAVTPISSTGHWSLQDNALALIDEAGPLQLAIVSFDTVRMTYRSHENIYIRR